MVGEGEGVDVLTIVAVSVGCRVAVEVLVTVGIAGETGITGPQATNSSAISMKNGKRHFTKPSLGLIRFIVPPARRLAPPKQKGDHESRPY